MKVILTLNQTLQQMQCNDDSKMRGKMSNHHLINMHFKLQANKKMSSIGSACCNPSDLEDRIREWHKDRSPPKEVACSLWCLHRPYGHVKPPLGDDMALGVEQGP